MIDSNPSLRTMLQEILEGVGFQTVSWSQRQGAIDVICHHRARLVILNSWLETPTGGISLLEALRENPETRDIPIIVTAVDEQIIAAHQEEIEQTATSVLLMPFAIQDLLAMVYRGLNRCVPAHLDGP